MACCDWVRHSRTQPSSAALLPRFPHPTSAQPHTCPTNHPRPVRPPLPMVLAQSFQLEALLNVLERQGVIRKAEVLEELKWLKARTPKGR